jgi:hypothetical protein
LCERLVEQNPRLKFLGNDDFGSSLLTERASFLLLWNASGRILVSISSVSSSSDDDDKNNNKNNENSTNPSPKIRGKKNAVAASVWPTVLGRVQEVVAFSDDFEEYEASILYMLLRDGPSLFFA